MGSSMCCWCEIDGIVRIAGVHHRHRRLSRFIFAGFDGKIAVNRSVIRRDHFKVSIMDWTQRELCRRFVALTAWVWQESALEDLEGTSVPGTVHAPKN